MMYVSSPTSTDSPSRMARVRGSFIVNFVPVPGAEEMAT